MSEIAEKWKLFHDHLPHELWSFPNTTSSLGPLINWPKAIYASWHYWKYLETNNPYHGLQVSVMLQQHPDSLPRNLLMDCVYQTWVESKRLESRKKKFMQASNEQLFLFIAQQLNLVCELSLEESYVRVMAKSDSLNRPFVKAPTFKDKYEYAQNNDPVFQITKLFIKNHILNDPKRPTEKEVERFVESFPTTTAIRILGSMRD